MVKIPPISRLRGRRISPITQISLIVLLIFLPLALLGLWLGRAKAVASWFDDAFAYRQTVAISSHTSAETNVYISVTIDTSTSGQFQSDCGDLRFTTVGGDLLPYYIVSGCGTATTVIHVFFQSFPAGAQTIYYYYGNPTADNGFSGTDFATEATGYVIGSTGSQEKGGAPVAYWKFDDATGTNAQDSSPNNNDGTITGASWQTEDMCVSGKCLKFDGTDDYTSSGDPTNGSLDFGTSGFTVSSWVRTGSATNQTIVSKRNSGTGSVGYRLRVNSGGGLLATYTDSSSNQVDSQSTGQNLIDNKWHHVVWVVNKSSNLSLLYVDGKATAMSASDISAVTATTSNDINFRVGYTPDNLQPFNGFMDDVKIYNYARTAAQVKADYASRGSNKGLALRTQGQALPDALSNGLVAYYKMDEASWTNDCSTTSVTDSSGNGNNGKSCPNGTGISTPAAGKFGLSGSFDGSDDYVQTTNLLSSGTFTISTWFNASAFPSTQNIISQGNSGGTYIGMHLNGSSKLLAYVDATNALTNTTTLSANTWYHATLTYDPNRNPKTILYLNGQQEATQNNNASFTGDKITIGISPTTSSLPFSGKIDETRIYNRALSPKEVRDLYNWAPGPVGYWNFEEGSGQSANDTSGNSNTGTATGTTIVSGKYGKGRSFNGSSDYVNIGDANSLTSSAGLALETWIKWDGNRFSAASGKDFASIISKGAYDNGEYAILMGRNSADATTNIAFYFNSALRLTWSNSSIDTNWHHLAATYDGATARIYLDGSQQTSGAVSTTMSNTANVLNIGAQNAGASYFWGGKLDDVRIYNRARTPAQIQEDLQAGRQKQTVGYWKFDEGYGTTANDTSINANNLTLSTASWTNSGKFGKAWNGTGALWLSRADDADFDVTATDDYGISLWFKSDSATNPSAAEYLVNKASSVIAGYAVYANTSGQICFGIDDDTTWNPDIASCSTADFYDAAWHHIAAIRDTVQDKTYIYIDGVLRDSDSDTTTATLANSLSLYVGDRDGTDNGDEFTGDLDELKIYRYALTQDEVKTDYNHGTALSLGSLSVNSSNVPLNSSSSSYCVPGSSDTCTAPVGEWNFEEGTGASAYDSSGNGNTGTLTNSPTRSTGKIGKGLTFSSATTDYVSVSYNSILDVSDSFTLELWFKTNGSVGGVEQDMLSNGADTPTRRRTLYFTSGGVLSFEFYSDGVNSNATAGTGYDNSQWHHVVGIRNTTTDKTYIYVDGIQKAAQNDNTTGSPSNANGWRIGDYFNGNGANDFNGIIDGVKIYNYARTAAQVAWDYNRGAPVAHWKFDECQGGVAYDSAADLAAGGSREDGTITEGGAGTNVGVGNCGGSAGTMWKDGATGKYNSSLNFDGTDDYVTMGDPASGIFDFGTNNFSVSAWAKIGGGAGTNRWIASKYAQGFTKSYNLSINSSNQFAFSISNGTTETIANTTTTYTDSNWHLVTGIRSGDNTYLYVDGILKDQKTGVSAYDVSNAIPLYVGARYGDGNGSLFFNGQIDDVQIYNYALTATQVKNLFNQGSAVRFGPQTGSP